MAVEETDFTTGSDVQTADGEKYGTLYEVGEGYIQVRVPQGALTDVERFIPRDLVGGVKGDVVVLTKSRDELDALDLTTPPTIE
jgi:hypothetical protein